MHERVQAYWRWLLREEEGSALITVLALIAILTVLVGTLWMVHVAQYRFLRRDTHRAQARYAAEAGLYLALDSLERNPYWQPADSLIMLPGGQPGESRRVSLTVEPFGAQLYVRSVAQQRRSRATARALIGEVPPADFLNAVVLWDTESRMHVAGHTVITGDVVVGERGLRESTFQRRRFTGRVDGTVHEVRDLDAPFADFGFFTGAVDRAEDMLGNGLSDPVPTEPFDGRGLARHLPSDNPVWREQGSLQLTSADSTRLARPITVVATQDLTVEGPLALHPGTRLIAGGTLTLRHGAVGQEVFAYGRRGVVLEDTVQCAGQFFSQERVRVQDDATLSHPSVLYVAGAADVVGGGIEILDRSVVDGTVVHPPLGSPPTRPRGRILIEPQARVRGAVYNAHETEMHGTVIGSLLTHQLYFYESPTHYVNWLLDAAVEVPGRPETYLLPLRFSHVPVLGIIALETVVDDVDTELNQVPL